MDVDAVADELYGEQPEAFVAKRDAKAREARDAGDRAAAAEIAGLKRPTVSAWVVNQLARHRRDRVDQLLDIGEGLREAQAALSADELRTLSEQRRRVVAALAREGRALANELGRPVSQAVEEEVAATLDAALADPGVAEAVRRGRLEKPMTYAGLGSLDVATSSTGGRATMVGRPAPIAGKQELRTLKQPDAVAAAQQRLEHAREVATEAAQRREKAEADAATAEAAAADAKQRVTDLHEQLVTAQEEAANTDEALRAARRRLSSAAKAERAAQEQLTKAQQRRDRAGPPAR